jgi:hypothetical protein
MLSNTLSTLNLKAKSFFGEKGIAGVELFTFISLGFLQNYKKNVL